MVFLSLAAMFRQRRLLAVPLVLAAVGAVAVAADWWSSVPRGVEVRYVGRNTCAECHAPQVEEWTGSDHDLAMQVATPETVLANFDDQQFTYQGVTSRMFRRGDKFFIHTEGPTGAMEDFEIKYTFGFDPLQQYMVEFPDGRVQVLRISWDTQNKRWFYVPPPDVLDEKIEPGDPLHWTGAAQNWNHTCAECHSTNLHKNYDLATDTYHTTWSEIDVSCEACHGPGSLHVELAKAKSLFWDRNHGYGLAKLKGESSKNQLETCAKCHSRRNIVHPDFSPGDNLLDHYEPELLHPGLYHADGQILDEVYVYGSFLQSKMYRKGVRCTDCHNPHSTEVKFEGNKLCAQCHQPGKYDTPAHHHHPVGSKGASCVECHMPETTYMVVDPRRDHSIRVPRPDLSVLLGTPNACNKCHTKEGEDAAWASEKVVEWYGERRPDDPHYAPALAAAREGKPEGEKLLLQVLRRDETPAIVRATVIEHLAQYPSQASVRARAAALRHADPLVRAAAVRSIPISTPGDVGLLAPLLSDPVRAVRIAAARQLAPVPSHLLPAKYQAALASAAKEYEQAQLASADRAGAHLNLGVLYEAMQQPERAIEALRTAIRVEPYLAGARSNLASLLEQGGASAEEVERLRQEELKLLQRDAKLLPDNPTVQYRYALTLYLLGQHEEAEEALEKAVALDPESYNYRLMLTLLYEKQQNWDEALLSTEALLNIRPNDPAALQILQRLMQSRR